MRLEVGCIDHQSGSPAAPISQFEQHLSKDAFLAPSLPTAVKGLVRTVIRRSVPPAQAIAIDKDDAAQNTLVINARLTVGLWKERLQLGHLGVAQRL